LVGCGKNCAEALAFAPNRAPIWIQNDHALKESGRLAEAEKAYSANFSMRSGPENRR
jgi:hypothetical protein